MSLTDLNEKIIRKATDADLACVESMLIDDELGQTRESVSDESWINYQKAFFEIQHDKNAELLVLEINNKIVAVAQVNYLMYLTYQGGKRVQIEGVRVHQDYRGNGYGEYLINQIIKRAEKDGCHMVQLTTNKLRDRAIKFYEKLGFSATHEGMKLNLKI